MEMRGRTRGREERDGCVGGAGDGSGSAGWAGPLCADSWSVVTALRGLEPRRL